MKGSGTYSPTSGGTRTSSKQQIAMITKAFAGALQMAIIIVMILDGIEIREISRFKYNLEGDSYNPYERSYSAATKDWATYRRVREMNIRLGILITIVVLVCLKQPALWLGMLQNQVQLLASSAVVDLICFVLYVIHLIAFPDNMRGECSAGLAVSLLSAAVTGVLTARVRDSYDY